MARLPLLSIASLLALASLAQYNPPDPSGMQGVIVERYYVADENDAADTDGGTGLTAGAVTYRVYVDLKPGYKLLTVGGFENHPITMGTSTTFFNNDDRGDAWGANINDIHLDKNTVGIDSWLTIGGASDAHWGVLKSRDTDGSIVGGVNNDGGSNSVPEGLLSNDAPSAGIPLTEADGLQPGVVPTINAVGTAPDLFESGGASSYTNANYAWAVLGGISAPDTANQILIGQFTTDGVLSLCLNFFVKLPDSLVCDDPACHEFMIFYANLMPSDTSGGGIADDNIFTHPTLCFDSSVLQADCEGVVGGPAVPGTPCDDGNSDTSNDTYAADCACLGEDCEGVMGGAALPGTGCDDGNPDTSSDTWQPGCICEGSVGVAEVDASSVSVTPNPTSGILRLHMELGTAQPVSYALIDLLGATVANGSFGARAQLINETIDITALPRGLYFLHMQVGGQELVQRVVKL